jgi:hypothetical protein
MTLTQTLEMTALPVAGPASSIDISDALDLLTAALHVAPAAESRSVVSDVVAALSVAAAAAVAAGTRLRDLYRAGRLPDGVTLGAVIVLDAAQRSAERGSDAAAVLDDATDAAIRFLDLVAPVPGVRQHFSQCAGRCRPAQGITAEME